jgi:N-carbamoyl-L-amino-acid hydrolase
MNMRRDALLAAAHLITTVNRVVTSIPGRQVGTVGRIQAEPGAVNVIPERVVMSLELRDLKPDKIRACYDRIRNEAEAIARRTGTKMSFKAIEELTPPALTDERIKDYIEEAARDLGIYSLRMPSGAGHDAQSIAMIAPIGMIFIPSVGGVSHSPLEFSRPGDIEKGLNVLLRTLFKVDNAF